MVEDGLAAVEETRIRRVVAEHLGLQTDQLSPEVSLTDDLAADSLDLVELAIELEEEFAVGLAEDSLDHVRTYGDLVDTVISAMRRERTLPPTGSA